MKSRDIIQKEALEAILPAYRAGVAVTMGGGKTLIGLKHMHACYNEFVKFLVAAPKKSIFKEWKDQAKQYNLEYLLPHIKFTTYRSLTGQSLDYDVLYLDECHSLLETHESWLSKYSDKIIGLTGTKPKFSTSEKGKLVNKYCPIVYEYTTDEAVEDEILNDYRIIVHSLNLNTAKTLRVEKGGKVWFTSEFESYRYWSNRIESAVSLKEQGIMRIMRMKEMMTFPSKTTLARNLLNSSTEKTILFANTQEQADSFGVPSYHSKNPLSESNLEKFKSGEILKLSTVLQLIEGINVPNLRQGIILHAYGNERKLAQRIGRLLRLNPKDVATVHILCYADTIDETWIKNALSAFDDKKITWL